MELRLAEAVKTTERNPSVKLSVLVEKDKVHYHLRRARLRGVPPASSKGGYNARLSPSQDLALQDFLRYLIEIGHLATKKHILLATNRILAQTGSNDDLSKQWARRWFKRHRDAYKTIKTRTLSYERKATHNKEDILKHFSDYKDTTERYGIDAADQYNMDETGFRIGCLDGRIVIAYKETRSVYIADPDNSDYITSMETGRRYHR